MHLKMMKFRPVFFVKLADTDLTFEFYAHFWGRAGYCVSKALGPDSFFARQY